MNTDTTNSRRPLRTGAALAVVLLLAVGLTGCEEGLLDVNDPDVVTPDALQGPSAVPTRINGLVGDFQEAYDDYVLYTALFTDEMILAGTFPTRIDVDERNVQQDISNASITSDVYEPLHVTRASADTAAAIFRAALDDEDFSEVKGELRDGIALAKFYGGYDRIFFSELFCQSIFGGPDGESAPVGSDARMEEALSTLQEAESAANEAGLSRVATAAKVGQARALIWLGRYQEAASAVSDVPDDFVYFSEYSTNTTAQWNEVYGLTNGDQFALRWTVGDGSADNRHNERWPYFEEWVAQGLIDPETDLEAAEIGVPVVLQKLYNGPSANIALASGWEARMIEAEAMLRSGQAQAAEELVNRLLTNPDLNPMTQVNPTLNDGEGPEMGAFDAVDFTDDGGFVATEDLPELARARAAGLWLSGQRQGTFRRFLEQDGVNLYPEGTQGNDTSFPVQKQELDNNPNISSACPAG